MKSLKLLNKKNISCLILVFVLLITSPSFSLSKSECKNFLISDKVAHLFFSFLYTQYLKNQNFSETKTFAVAFTAGILKEFFDFINKKKIDGPDLLFNLFGIMTGFLLNF